LKAGKKLLILVDQFEELFRFKNIYAEQNKIYNAQHFVDLLLGAVGQKEVPVYIIMTVRSDFLGDCEQFMGLPEAINDGQFLIPRMNRDELKTSITGPVEVVNGKISPQLVHLLLNEVGNSPDQLPVLQHVLMRTWEVWEKENQPAKPVEIEEYTKTGGMDKALSNHAEEAFEELNTEKKRKLSEAIFKTITLKGPDNRGIRRPTSLEKIALITNSNPEDIIEIANVFRRADRGFLMPPATIQLNRNSILDISHESLMRVWERLGNWVEEEAESSEIYQRVCESALLYNKNMAGLWRDPDLQIATEWISRNNPNQFWANQYNDNYSLAMRFIESSVQDKEFQVKETHRRRNLTRIAAGVFLIMLSSLTVWAFLERNQSEKSEKLALLEKQKAEKQESIANVQKLVAEKNSIRAEKEKANAEQERANAEQATLTAFEQRKIAVTNAKEAEIQKLKAEKALLTADDARRSAEIDKQIALNQRQLSDSLKTIAFESEKNAYRLRILSIAQKLSVKSVQPQPPNYDPAVKPLLALQAYKFNTFYDGKPLDTDIINALFSAHRLFQSKTEYLQNLHTDAVRSLCYSPDGKSLASSGNDGKLVICNATNLQSEPKSFSQVQQLIEIIQYNHSGTKIAASTDKNILIYNVNDLSQKPKLLNIIHKDKISGLVWYNEELVTASLSMDINVIDKTGSKIIKTYTLPSKPFSLSICEEKNLLVIGCENGWVYIIDLIKETEVRPLKKITMGPITSIDIESNGNRIACGTSEGTMVIFRTNHPDNNEINIVAHGASISNIKFDPSNNFIASSSLDGTVKLWNLNSMDEQAIVFSEHDSWVYGLAFSPDGSILASCGRDKTVRTYNIQANKMLGIIQSKVNRNFTEAEWNLFVGTDIPYEKTIPEK